MRVLITGSQGPEPRRPPTVLVDLRDITLDHLRGLDDVANHAALSNDPLGNLAPEAVRAGLWIGAQAVEKLRGGSIQARAIGMISTLITRDRPSCASDDD